MLVGTEGGVVSTDPAGSKSALYPSVLANRQQDIRSLFTAKLVRPKISIGQSPDMMLASATGERVPND
jgi:hypothetical protein